MQSPAGGALGDQFIPILDNFWQIWADLGTLGGAFEESFGCFFGGENSLNFGSVFGGPSAGSADPGKEGF